MRICNELVLTLGLVAAVGCVESADEPATATATAQPLTLNDRITACSSDPRVLVGALSVDTCVGGDLFLRETFNGNGRSCGTCHPTEHNATIDPAFISRLPANDPLFVAEFNPALAKLEIPSVMRQFGLILENVDGFSDPTRKFVLRSVPHTLSLATSVTRAPTDPTTPAERTGWSGDGAPDSGSLRDFQNGAIRQHYTKSLSRVVGTDFRLATSGELDRIDHFMRQNGRLNELDLTTVVLEDAGAEAGRQRFLTVGCNGCHGNAGANASFGGGGNRNFNTGVETARNSALAAFPHDGGFGTVSNTSSGPFGDGTFSAPPLIEAADTGPFFHTATTISGASAHNTGVATTIEEAVAFYDSPAFNSSPSGQAVPINLTETEINNIGRFLRVLNASFNTALAARRLAAAAALLNAFGLSRVEVQNRLLELTKIEVDDAVRELTEVGITGFSLDTLNGASVLIPGIIDSTDIPFRADHMEDVRLLLSTAARRFGTNLTIQIGDGPVMF
ncbi:MAG TPA: hypothetical protein VFK02_23735 [Kofleriaceae bacterium]|nr:hypothetical protein [Kofleriaceae bacterium]